MRIARIRLPDWLRDRLMRGRRLGDNGAISLRRVRPELLRYNANFREQQGTRKAPFLCKVLILSGVARLIANVKGRLKEKQRQQEDERKIGRAPARVHAGDFSEEPKARVLAAN